MEKTTWEEMCEVCEKETLHKVTDSKPPFISVGLLGSEKIECQECGTKIWV